jgi:hypothetical protein
MQCYFVPDRCVPKRKVSDETFLGRGFPWKRRPVVEASPYDPSHREHIVMASIKSLSLSMHKSEESRCLSFQNRSPSHLCRISRDHDKKSTREPENVCIPGKIVFSFFPNHEEARSINSICRDRRLTKRQRISWGLYENSHDPLPGQHSLISVWPRPVGQVSRNELSLTQGWAEIL